MKKVYMLVVLAFSVLPLVLGQKATINSVAQEERSGVVDYNAAELAARNFFQKRGFYNTGVKPTLSYQATLTRSNVQDGESEDTPLFYAFNNGGNGYVIVAASYYVDPILAYSKERAFDYENLAPGAKYWLKKYEKQIAWILQNKNGEARKEINAKWDQWLSHEAPADAPLGVMDCNDESYLLRTTWSQGRYYNSMCPTDTLSQEDGHTLVGCVALAMGQVMKYWNYPAIGTGSLSYQHVNYGTISADFGATNYEWWNMPNSLNDYNDSISTLLSHCGISVYMNYGPDFSGAYTLISGSSPGSAQAAYSTYFNFQSPTPYERVNHTDSEWSNLIVAEMNAGRPVQYEAYDDSFWLWNPDEGHSFVIDGYNSDDNIFHINWGWGGSSDGWYLINDLTPSEYNFDDDEKMLTNIRPNFTIPDGNDDDFQNATSIGGTSINISGELTPGDSDWYSFDYNGSTYYFELIGEGFYAVDFSITGNVVNIETLPLHGKATTEVILYDIDGITEFGRDAGSGQYCSFSILSYSFPQQTPVSCTSLITPSTNSNVDVNTVFQWSQVQEATSYQLTIGTTPGSGDLYNEILSQNSFSPPNELPYGATLYINVRPFNSQNSATGCQEIILTTEPVPIPDITCTNLITPLNNATDVSITTSLSWADVPGATGYYISVIGSQTGFILDNVDLVYGNSYLELPEPLPYGEVISVTITPYNQNEVAVNCPTETFTTEAAPPACSDGIQNGDETGIDCGGSSCLPCGPTFPDYCQLGLDIEGEWGFDNSGYSVSLSSDGSVMAIGAPGNSDNLLIESGHVRVYEWDGMNWLQRGVDINGESANDASGYSVSLSSDGSVVAIGAPGRFGEGSVSNHVRVYEWDGMSWLKRGVDIDGESANDASGYSVSLSSDGSVVAIGARLNDGNGANAGHVQVYEWDGMSWLQRGVDIDGESAGDQSGYSVSLSSDGSVVAIGAPRNGDNGDNSGHVRIYEWDGMSWLQRGVDINGESANDASGYSVSLSSGGSVLAIGAPRNGDNGADAGHVRVYEWDGMSWLQRGVDIDGESSGDRSGHSVTLSSDGSVVAIGARLNDGNGDNSGHVRIYEWGGTSWLQRGVDIDGESSGDWSGHSVTLSSDGSVLAIGAPGGNNDNGANAGHVRVYEACSSCDISGIGVSHILACTPGTNTFTADVTITFQEAPDMGTLDLTGDGSASVAVGSLDGTVSHVFVGVEMPADGGAIELTATFSDVTSCTFTESNACISPISCAPTCTDGIQNGDETGVDCGGMLCGPCNADDYCGQAIALPVFTQGNCSFADYSTVNAASSGVNPSCGNTSWADDDVWFVVNSGAEGWSAGINVTVNFDNNNGSGIAIHTGSCGTLTPVACDQTLSVPDLEYAVPIPPNTDVYIQVWSYGNGPQFRSAFEICVEALPPIPGCTDPNAHNYDPMATQGDNSCETCSDGIQNGDETDVDCGGMKCQACPCEILSAWDMGPEGNLSYWPTTLGIDIEASGIIMGSGASRHGFSTFGNPPACYSVTGLDSENLNPEDYLSIQLNSISGENLDLEAFQIDLQRGLVSGYLGANQWVLKSSLDNYTSEIDAGEITTINQWEEINVSLSGLQNIGNTVEFRLYGYGAEHETWGRLYIDNIKVCGSISGGCMNQLTLHDTPIESDHYMSSSSITSSGTISSNTTVTFQAAQSITLQPGFHAQAGSDFLAMIGDCTPATLAQEDNPGEIENEGQKTSKLPERGVVNLNIFPNPFRNETTIRYTLPEHRSTQLVLIDMLGRAKVLHYTAVQAAGTYEYQLSSADLGSGTYFIQLQTGDEVITRKVQVLH